MRSLVAVEIPRRIEAKLGPLQMVEVVCQMVVVRKMKAGAPDLNGGSGGLPNLRVFPAGQNGFTSSHIGAANNSNPNPNVGD